MMAPRKPHVVVFSSLFPAPRQPQAGLFIRERMFRVAARLPLTVVSPVPWFPGQSLIRRRWPHYRPEAPRREIQSGIEVLRPRFLSVPGVLKSLDGLFLAIGSFQTLLALKRAGRLDVLDAHFAYPDGYAATLLGRWLNVPVTVTLRGTEPRHAATRLLRGRVAAALRRASRIFAVAGALKRTATALGIPASKIRVIGNGVDAEKFHPVSKMQARSSLGLPETAPVLISVGGLVERKGFHRVIECIPALRQRFPGLQYLIVGGASAEGDISARLRAQVAQLGLQDSVRFLGAMPPEDLKVPLSAADVFVLATRNEGWANVFLEAMACGIPVVTTDVGGNAEVVCQPELGIIVPFGDQMALCGALESALERPWQREAIIAHALANSWNSRVDALAEEFERLASAAACETAPVPAGEAGGR
jgi:glycosyltransferase involved in cell wall biosynthesis